MRVVGATLFEQWLRDNAGVVGSALSAIGQQTKPAPKISKEELGGLLISYVIESNHGGWEGYTPRDKTGINKFLADLTLYYQSAVKDDPDAFKKPIFTGSTTFP